MHEPVPPVPAVTASTTGHVQVWREQNAELLAHNHTLREAVGTLPAGGSATVSPDLGIPVAPFQETFRGQRMERVAWAIEQVVQITGVCSPSGPTRRET